MELYGVKLDVIAYTVLITGLCTNGDIAHAFKPYEEMKQRRLCPNTTTYAVLIDAVCRESNLVKGEMLLMDLEQRGLIAQDGSTQDLHERLKMAMKRVDFLRRKRK